MKRLTKRLIVISFDCLSSLDLPMLKELPHFKELLQQGSYCKSVEPIYPSVTYPSHASIVTGNFPNKHGIVNNTYIQPGALSPDWHWHRKDINGTTLYDEAKKAGMKTAALLWPVTARAKIDYNMPEIFANRPWQFQIPVSLWNGSMGFQLDMHRRFRHIRNGIHQPALDDFVLEATVHTLVTKQPDLMLIHFTDLDTQRHYHGFSSEEALASLRRHDVRLGRIMQALKENDLYESSTLVALGDHSALDESIAIQVNTLFLEKGLITMNEANKVTKWQAFCHSCDGSAYIYLHKQADSALKEQVKQLLEEKMKDEANGIEAMISGEEANKRGADGQCTFMLEAKKGFYFSEALHGGFLHEVTQEEADRHEYTLATHGYSPSKENYDTIFIAAGAGITPHQEISSMRLVDEGPTFARLLGLSLGDTDGNVIEELLHYD
ncbi:type I phosphodiesterase/nucleotide pyrophosphatase [Fictibacillus macauensis ZFHKF-1]|uniref:Type I phosphodiesterase/nucleotide pyrophosphatase n=1 Tax=Fictibacillus macauensis ZFHKF-1 TaxID=1196324 RepID=I8J1G5_9BACL|nr:ectonucleotide pyrophosphatase/phosphodiesterase [Fictibacillus macauensis]EIT85571.1 type I phosphodiesterase/nucleotide pyrophosphatase [Fictibacillus macauensis ZFHKF-1]